MAMAAAERAAAPVRHRAASAAQAGAGGRNTDAGSILTLAAAAGRAVRGLRIGAGPRVRIADAGDVALVARCTVGDAGAAATLRGAERPRSARHRRVDALVARAGLGFALAARAIRRRAAGSTPALAVAADLAVAALLVRRTGRAPVVETDRLCRIRALRRGATVAGDAFAAAAELPGRAGVRRVAGRTAFRARVAAAVVDAAVRHRRATELRAGGVGAAEIGAAEIGVDQAGVAQVGQGEIGPAGVGPFEAGAAEVAALAVDVLEGRGAAEVAVGQVGALSEEAGTAAVADSLGLDALVLPPVLALARPGAAAAPFFAFPCPPLFLPVPRLSAAAGSGRKGTMIPARSAATARRLAAAPSVRARASKRRGSIVLSPDRSGERRVPGGMHAAREPERTPCRCG